MTTPTTIAGTQVLIKIGNGASPEVFTHPCLINGERSVTFRTNSNDIVVPDCTNPEDPAWREVEKDSKSMTISGTGMLDNVLATLQAYTTWVGDNVTKNVQVWLSTTGYWEGAFKLTELGVGGDRGAKATITLTLESHGAISAFTAAP